MSLAVTVGVDGILCRICRADRIAARLCTMGAVHPASGVVDRTDHTHRAIACGGSCSLASRATKIRRWSTEGDQSEGDQLSGPAPLRIPFAAPKDPLGCTDRVDDKRIRLLYIYIYIYIYIPTVFPVPFSVRSQRSCAPRTIPLCSPYRTPYYPRTASGHLSFDVPRTILHRWQCKERHKARCDLGRRGMWIE
jgi:hypothetical protein